MAWTGVRTFCGKTPHVLAAGNIWTPRDSAQIDLQRSERKPESITHRKGYRRRDWETSVGAMELGISKIPESSYFPSLPEVRSRREQALLSAV
ncbi:MAG: transposase [Deltaproteobacteria bacterium]|nr:transposase [Deltaproteobacteria bacterium]